MSEQNSSPHSYLYKVVFLAVSILVAAEVVVTLAICIHGEWHSNLVRFTSRVWDRFVSYNVGSTAPGFFSSLLLTVLGIVIVVLFIAYAKGMQAMKEHVVESAGLAISGIVTVIFLVYGTQFVWEVAKVGYEDHRDLAARVITLTNEKAVMVSPDSLTTKNLELKKQLDVSQAQLAMRKQMVVVGDPAFGNIRKVLLAFQSYRLYANGRRCFVYITAPTPSPIVTALGELSNSVSTCFTSSSEGKHGREADNAAAKGMVDGTVLIHAPKGDVGAARIEEALSGTLPIERSYDPYPEEASHYQNESKGDLVVWLQFGPNVRWTSDHSGKGQK